MGFFLPVRRNPIWFMSDAQPINAMNVACPFGYGISNGAGGYSTASAYTLGYASWALAMPSGLRSAFISAGIDTWRIVVECSPMCLADSEGAGGTTDLDTYIGQVTSAVSTEIAAGLKVVVDLFAHSSPAHGSYSVTGLVASGYNGAVFQRYTTVAKRLAAALEALNRPDVVAFEAFNEWPTIASYGTHTPKQFREYLHTECRASAPRTTLVVSAPEFASMAQTALMDKISDNNIIYKFDAYEDIAFTYQGHPTPPVLGLQYVTGLQFPPDTTNANSVLTAAKAAIDADGALSAGEKTTYKANLDTRIGNYRDTPYGQTYMDGLLGDVETWRVANSIPAYSVWEAETGAWRLEGATYPGAPIASKAAYLEAKRTIIKGRGYSRGIFEAIEEQNGWIVTDGSQNIVSNYLTAMSA